MKCRTKRNDRLGAERSEKSLVSRCRNEALERRIFLSGDTLNVLASFNGSNGSGPLTNLALSGNMLYGTTSGGGDNINDGTVFSVPLAGGTITVLTSFDGSNGANPYAGVILSGNTLYGTTEDGTIDESNDAGTVFSIPMVGGSPTVLASFPALISGTNSQYPLGGVILSDGTLYGTSESGFGFGTVFSVPVTGGTPTILAKFNGTNGKEPKGGLILLDNVLYGTTEQGGANGDGTVFSVPITGGTPTTVASFDGSNGEWPEGALTVSGNTLYGTTSRGGNKDDGTVFSVPVSGGSPTTLASFNGRNGETPDCDLALASGVLYGTTVNGGAHGRGTVFSVSVTGGTPTVLASFNGSNGQYPERGLVLSGNTLFGTTYAGGAFQQGTIFSLQLAGPSVRSSAFDYDSGAPQGVAYAFDQDVSSSIGANDFTVTGPSGAVPFTLAYDNVNDSATLSFSSILADGNYTATAIASGITNSAGTHLAANSALKFFFLNGDANHDRTVNILDFTALAQNFNQSSATFSQGDFNYDGKVNALDFNILATAFGASLAPPAGSPFGNRPLSFGEQASPRLFDPTASGWKDGLLDDPAASAMI